MSDNIESKILRSGGTSGFRAPEILNRKCKSFVKADIYSAWIILFCLRFGKAPYRENQKKDDQNLHKLLLNQSEFFWEVH